MHFLANTKDRQQSLCLNGVGVIDLTPYEFIPVDIATWNNIAIQQVKDNVFGVVLTENIPDKLKVKRNEYLEKINALAHKSESSQEQDKASNEPNNPSKPDGKDDGKDEESLSFSPEQLAEIESFCRETVADTNCTDSAKISAITSKLMTFGIDEESAKVIAEERVTNPV